MAKIIDKRKLTPVTHLFRLEAPLIAAAAQAGQFVIVRVHKDGERIPLTIADYEPHTGIITIVVQEVGATTRQLGALKVGDEILDVAGPLRSHPTNLRSVVPRMASPAGPRPGSRKAIRCRGSLAH